MPKLFIAIDGDDIGHHIEYLVVTNQTILLKEFSDNFHYSMKWLEEIICKEFNAVIIFNGGDNLLAEFFITKHFFEKLESIRTDFSKTSGKTLSIGLGKDPRRAFVALQLAKANGKNCIIDFDEAING